MRRLLHRSSLPVALAGAAFITACQRAEPSTGRTAMDSSIRRGRALLIATRDSLPGHVGNNLRCTSCHLDEGRRPEAFPWIGVTARYPQYRSRNAAVSTIEDRINDCLERSMNGTAIPIDSREMRDMVAYMTSLSAPMPAGDVMHDDAPPVMRPLAPDTTRGARLFSARCTPCHGDHGQGTLVAPALWGDSSFNIGAGMARLRTMAAFVRHNMPYGNATLTDQQAFDVAAYIDSRPRPDFPGKEKDWPRGGAPPDVPYSTDANH
ncbi:MAG TPA: c-type cytochrome [Gemmatimonadaceae bacterium]